MVPTALRSAAVTRRCGPRAVIGWNWPADGRGCRPSMILRRVLPVNSAVALLVLHLRVHARSRWLVCCLPLRWLRPGLNARPATITGARIVVVAVVVVVVVAVIVGSRIAGAVVVGVVDHAHVEVIVGPVIEEVAAVPVAAFVAEADVAKAVVDAALEANVQAPMAGIKEIPAAVEAPVARRPERRSVGWFNPRARHPVVTLCTPGPVARRPDVSRSEEHTSELQS